MYTVSTRVIMLPSFVISAALTTFRSFNPLISSANSVVRLKTTPQIYMSTSAKTSDPYPARTAVITGGSGGIGEQTAKGLVRTLPQLEDLYLCCRNIEKGEQVAQPLRDGLVAGRPINVHVIPVELTNWKSINDCANNITEALEEKSLDLLICNAGMMASPLDYAQNVDTGEYSVIEKQFAVNHLSHVLLTNRLLPSLREGDGGKVVFVSSMAVAISKGRTNAPLVREKTDDVVNKRNYSRWGCYGDSKLAMSLYAKAVAEKEGGHVESVSLHPGVVQTELGRYLVPEPLARMMKGGGEPSFIGKAIGSLLGLKTPEQGAELSIELSAAPRGRLNNGMMYIAVGGKEANSSVIPLLNKEQEWKRVYEDAMKFVETV